MSIAKKLGAVPVSFVLVAASTMNVRAQSFVERLTGSLESEFGASVAAAGDFDGDGTRDLLVGAPEDGEAIVFSGTDHLPLWSSSGGVHFGRAVLGDVDLDGDGRSEVVVSRPVESGSIRIFGGPHGSLLRHVPAPVKSLKFGHSLCHGEDIDGDGTPELVIGAPQKYPTSPESGQVYYYSYAKDEILRVLVLLDSDKWGLGTAVADVGDVDDDGMIDLAVSYRFDNNVGGGVRIYSGKNGVVLNDIVGPEDATGFGASIVGLGPIAPGGNAMIAVGAPLENSESGAVYRYDALTGTLVDRFVGSLHSEFGAALAASERPGEPGSHVLFVGAPARKWSTPVFGRVAIFDGVKGTLLHEITSPDHSDAFGASIASLGDILGDEEPEFAVGAPRWLGWSGAVHVHEGVTPCGAAKSLGGGYFGSFGITPSLTIDGCLRASAPTNLEFEIAGGPHFATVGFLFLGAFDGTLKLNPYCSLQFAQIFGSPIALPITPGSAPFPMSIGTGKFSATATLPETGYSYSFRAQMVIADTGSPFGFSTTNGVELTFEP